MRQLTLSVLSAALLLRCATPAATQAPAPQAAPPPAAATESSAPAMQPLGAAALLSGSPETFIAACDKNLADARAAMARVTNKGKPLQGLEALRAYDAATAAVGLAADRSSLARQVSPDANVRKAAGDCEQKASALATDLSLDRGIYDVISKVDVSKEDAATQKWLEKALLAFRRAGVDRDEATRNKVKALFDELVMLGQQFAKNISEDKHQAEFAVKDLDGLPPDYLKTHPVGPNGKVTVTTEYPDYFPFMAYAKSAKAREALWRVYRQRAYPKNLEALSGLIQKRSELAMLLGYPNWAAYVTEDKMSHTEKVAADFIEKANQAALGRAQKDYKMLLARKKKDAPKATALDPWDYDYYTDRVKAEQLGFDSQAVRPYFEYSRVKLGVMDITSRLFGVGFKAVTDAKVWHPDVETFDVTENGQVIGRIHLDMHPRPDKYKHAAQMDLANGELGKRLPEGVLACNFPKPGEAAALMSADEVEVFFHEFGHLMHYTFAGRQQWAGIAGTKTELDFVETPSMLLQEWASDPDTLATFARHYQTGVPIPRDLVEKLRASKEFGSGLWTRRQLFLSAVSLSYYNQAPGFDTTKVFADLQDHYRPFRTEHLPGTYFQLAFNQLDDYSAAYYTYIWSMVIAKDLLQQFKLKGMLDPATAIRYRHAVLDPGGSKDANDLVKDFLGRPYSFDAYAQWLNAG